MSDTALGLPNERETLFVDPWSKKPNHQGMVPVDALFVGAWDNDLGIDNINEALFLVRDDRQDLLWSLTTHSEKTTRENLDARESGDPAWIKSEITCGCVAGAPRGHAEQSGDAASGRARACKGSLPVPTTAISARPPRER